jgi:hypothetical protein
VVECYQPAHAPLLGGKNASLGTLLTAGLPVPPGFAVSADCYRKALADGGLAGQLDALLPAPPARVWTALTRADQLGVGLPQQDLLGSATIAVASAFRCCVAPSRRNRFD